MKEDYYFTGIVGGGIPPTFWYFICGSSPRGWHPGVLEGLMVPNFGEGTWQCVICGGFMGETKNLKPYKIHPGSPKTKLCPLLVGSPESMDHPKDQPLCLVLDFQGPCMIHIFTYIYQKSRPIVGKYTSSMNPMGLVPTVDGSEIRLTTLGCIKPCKML